MTSAVSRWLSMEMLRCGKSNLLILQLLFFAINPSQEVPPTLLNGEGTVRINKVNRIADSYTIITANVFVLVSWISFFIPPLAVEGRLAVLMTALIVEANISSNAHSEEVKCHAVYSENI